MSGRERTELRASACVESERRPRWQAPTPRRRARPLTLACLIVGAIASACATDDAPGSSSGELTEVASFGSNPGGLRMWLYAPARPASPAAVVVALHGCTQSAADIERTGWSTIADQAGFYVIYPQQTSSNNGASCFRWFEPAHVRRGSGEVASIASMVSHVKSRFAIDDARVFAAGFSAGGGMAPALLAAYPDVFAAGAAHSGLPVAARPASRTRSTARTATSIAAAAIGRRERARTDRADGRARGRGSQSGRARRTSRCGRRTRRSSSSSSRA